jgi:hypothetical protein
VADRTNVSEITIHGNSHIIVNIEKNGYPFDALELQCSGLRGKYNVVTKVAPFLMPFKGDSWRLESFNFLKEMWRLPRKTSSRQTFDNTKGWLEECLSDAHPYCAGTSSKLRNRVLQSIRFLKIQDNKLILVIDTIPNSYAALSHCWGSGQTIPRTTINNLEHSMSDGIILTDLPKTFRDAVRVCRNLNIPFIWIDSLCIVQDDDDD